MTNGSHALFDFQPLYRYSTGMVKDDSIEVQGVGRSDLLSLTQDDPFVLTLGGVLFMKS